MYQIQKSTQSINVQLNEFSPNEHPCKLLNKAGNRHCPHPKVSLIITPSLTTKSNTASLVVITFLLPKTVTSPVMGIPEHCNLVLPDF